MCVCVRQRERDDMCVLDEINLPTSVAKWERNEDSSFHCFIQFSTNTNPHTHNNEMIIHYSEVSA